ncbi:hypothetical protein MJL33_31345, partial [Salmonella enterica subsp. enterica serovar Kentucky]|nr:hypothetical protein [Salmonella enterica subsp. enterica serovar Kentucky]
MCGSFDFTDPGDRYTLWQHDFAALANPHVVSVVYFVMFATLFLENGLLPASFLPGDS